MGNDHAIVSGLDFVGLNTVYRYLPLRVNCNHSWHVPSRRYGVIQCPLKVVPSHREPVTRLSNTSDLARNSVRVHQHLSNYSNYMHSIYDTYLLCLFYMFRCTTHLYQGEFTCPLLIHLLLRSFYL